MNQHLSNKRRDHEYQSLRLREMIPATGPTIPPAAETDPVFARSEAAKLVPGDKAKLDSAVQLEFDPVFGASEAKLFVPGDKAKLDTAMQPGQNVSQLTNDAGYLTSQLTQDLYAGVNSIMCNGYLQGNLSLISLPSGQLLLAAPIPQVVLDWYQQKLLGTWTVDALQDNAGNPYSTGGYTPVNPGDWVGTPPATVAEVLNRLIALASNNGTTPIP